MEKILDYFGVKAKVISREDDDRVDRLNHRQTVVLFVMFAVIVSSKTFVGEPISCWVPNQFSGNQEDYVNSYCWIKNTYYLPTEESVPKEHENNPDNVVTYYQWTPLIMLIEALFFYFPYAIWSSFSTRSGLDLNSMVEAGSKLNATEMSEVREKTLKYMTSQMDRYLAKYGVDEHKSATISVKQLLCACRFLRGSYLYAFFISIKLLYLVNGVVQFLVLSHFLGGSFFMYGFQMISTLFSGVTDQLVYQLVPSVTMCDFKVRRLGNIHRYTVQCVLTINHFNEKIFFFIWVWLLMVNVANVASLVAWASRMCRTSSRENYVARHVGYLKNMPDMKKMLEKKNIKLFVDYLKHDGVFILYLLTINADTIAVTDFLENLARNFAKKKRVVASNEGDDSIDVDDVVDSVDNKSKARRKWPFSNSNNKNNSSRIEDSVDDSKPPRYNHVNKMGKISEESEEAAKNGCCAILPCVRKKQLVQV